MSLKAIPNILCISGLDPSGGAGLQADIETISSCGGHAFTLCSALTAQNYRTVSHVQATDMQLLCSQFALIREENSVAACKIGLIPNRKTADIIMQLLQKLPSVPVVLDPIGIASNGAALASQSLFERVEPLLSITTVLTPNTAELLQLDRSSQQHTEIINTLLGKGVQSILLTGGDLNTPQVENKLYDKDHNEKTYSWPRLPHSYHGSGCTLSSALATFLGRGLSIQDAAHEAQSFTWRTLQQAKRVGKQFFPQRISNPATSLIEQKYTTDE